MKNCRKLNCSKLLEAEYWDEISFSIFTQDNQYTILKLIYILILISLLTNIKIIIYQIIILVYIYLF